jgi:hypothetical protein
MPVDNWNIVKKLRKLTPCTEAMHVFDTLDGEAQSCKVGQLCGCGKKRIKSLKLTHLSMSIDGSNNPAFEVELEDV